MPNQFGNSGRGSDVPEEKQGQGQSNQQRQDQGGQSGKQAGPVLPEGEKVGEWSEDEQDEGRGAGGPAESGGGGYGAPGAQPGGSRQGESEKPGGGSDKRWGEGSESGGSGSKH
jgi:hypothetical protein